MNLQNFLLISKDPETARLLEAAVPSHTTIHTAPTVSEGLRLWQETSPILVICEGNPYGLAPLFEYARQTSMPTPILAIGERHSVKDAVEIMRAGASDYLTKPILLQELRATVTRLARQPASAGTSDQLRDRFAPIISVSPQMHLIKHLAKEVALTDATVLITGESGTGKELFAHAIHATSPRANGPLIALNCAGIPENLLEAELFGYQQGAFTDAKQAKPGRFQMAEGGTLFKGAASGAGRKAGKWAGNWALAARIVAGSGGGGIRL